MGRVVHFRAWVEGEYESRREFTGFQERRGRGKPPDLLCPHREPPASSHSTHQTRAQSGGNQLVCTVFNRLDVQAVEGRFTLASSEGTWGGEACGSEVTQT